MITETPISENPLRVGNFTSSEIWKLMKKGTGTSVFGAPALTYIHEKNIERRMGVSIKQEVYTRPIAWGWLMEKWVNAQHLGFDYDSVGDKTIPHPIIEFWKGSPDFKCTDKGIIAECKGYERKNFAEYAESIETKSIEIIKSEHPEEYWQMVSNACILGFDFIQPILYMPYKSELPAIREFVDNYDGEDQWKYKYVYDALDNQLPHLPDNGYYKNLYTCILEVPAEDKKLLTDRVLLAGNMLNPFYVPKTITA